MTKREMQEESALVTGASSGIGAAFARRLASAGRPVVLVARRADRLEGLAAELRGASQVGVHVVPADLSRAGAVQDVLYEVERRGLAIDLLVNNAGFGTSGPFHQVALERELEEIAVNVTALVELTGRCLPDMVRRGKGAVVNVSSTAAYAPMPYMATYAATKAFVLSFSESLAEELRGTGVKVLCLCPGATRTGFQEVAGIELPLPELAWMQPDQVAEEALRALDSGRPVLISGLRNRVAMASLGLLPRRLLVRMMGLFFRAGRLSR